MSPRPPASTLAPASFAYVRDLLARSAAIRIEDRQTYLVEARLTPLARTHGFPSVDALVARLRRDPGNGLAGRVVDAMTTNETSFFRDPRAFAALETTVLPGLIASRGGVRRLRIWSAACSTGQEPYSVAMLLADRFPQLASWDVEILATDLSTDALDRARRGTYTQQEVNRGLPAARLVRFFERDGIHWRVRPAIRDLVTFRELNLARQWAGLPRTDLVLLRNVLLYFPVATRQDVLVRVARTLASDGWLLLGAAETTLHLETPFRRVPVDGTSCYRLEGASDAHR